MLSYIRVLDFEIAVNRAIRRFKEEQKLSIQRARKHIDNKIMLEKSSTKEELKIMI